MRRARRHPPTKPSRSKRPFNTAVIATSPSRCGSRARTVLAARGDEQAAALRVLEGCTTTAGLILFLADLYAGSGQLPALRSGPSSGSWRAISRRRARAKRHARWTAALGYVRRPRAARRGDYRRALLASGPPVPFLLAARGRAQGRRRRGVYEAEDELLGRKVAFKVYHGRGADRAALEREARLAAHLAGPGIVRVFDADPEAGWITLEWIPRGSIRDRLRAGDLEPLVPVGRWARPLAHALARVHAAPGTCTPISSRPTCSFDKVATRRSATSGSPGPSMRPVKVEVRATSRPSASPAAPRISATTFYAYGRVLEDVLHQPRVARDGPWRPTPSRFDHRSRSAASVPTPSAPPTRRSSCGSSEVAVTLFELRRCRGRGRGRAGSEALKALALRVSSVDPRGGARRGGHLRRRRLRQRRVRERRHPQAELLDGARRACGRRGRDRHLDRRLQRRHRVRCRLYSSTRTAR